MATLRSPARPLVLAVGLAGVGAFAGYWALLWTVRGSYPTASIMLAVSLWGLGFAAFYVATALGVETMRAASDETGTLLRPRRLVDTVTIMPIAGITIASSFHLIFSQFGMVDYVTSGVMRAVPLGCILLVLLGAPTLYRTIKHRGGGYLRLTPAGFEVWNSHWNALHRGTWDELEQILDRKPKGGRPFNELIVFVPSKGPNAVLYSDAITGDSDALREWVRFYWTHPEHRSELTDDRGLQRLRHAPV